MPVPIIIGICGGTGCGKTTLCEAIVEKLGPQVFIISQDMYYLDLSHMCPEQRDRQNFDHPDALDSELFKANLETLRQGNPVRQPLYDFVSHTRTGASIPLMPRKIILAEGIMLFADPAVADLLDYKVFMDTAPDLRFIRRLRRDLKERGRTMESVISQWVSSVKPMHDMYVEPCKESADIVVSDDDIDEMVDRIVDMIFKQD